MEEWKPDWKWQMKGYRIDLQYHRNSAIKLTSSFLDGKTDRKPDVHSNNNLDNESQS